MNYKNQTYYWILPLNAGEWTLAKHIEGTWHFVDGRCRLTNDLGQIGEEIPNTYEMLNQRRMHDGLVAMLKTNHETLLSVYSNANFGQDTLVKQQVLRDEMKNILELLKQAEQK